MLKKYIIGKLEKKNDNDMDAADVAQLEYSNNK